MKKILILLSIIAICKFQGDDEEKNKCNLIIKGIFQGLTLSYQVNQQNIMENLNCNDFLNAISISVQFSKIKSYDSLQIGWDELGNAFEEIHKSIIKQQQIQSQVGRFINNLKLKLKNKVTCDINSMTEKLSEYLLESNYFSEQFDDWKEGRYFQYGQKIGKMLLKIQLPIVNLKAIFEDLEVVLEVFSGLQNGIKDQSQIESEQIVECLEGADQMIVYFDDFIFQTQRNFQALSTHCIIQEIVLALNHYINALEKCQDSILNAPILIQNLKKFNVLKDFKPENLLKLEKAKQSIINQKEQFLAVCWKMGYWFGFGEQISIYLQFYTQLQDQNEKNIENDQI
ncbi:unnamed protein product [Paramecium sonneborni]|uniref:Kinase domain protein n=1 Tax=Paramecium sonneborni TaxID=65129 RepID=A0A8S1RF05_9CILI|nr:unnamed protein product [Paramecium sonneborni]